MKRHLNFLSPVLILSISILSAAAVFGEQVKLVRQGWSIIADPEQEMLAIEYDALDAVLQQVQLNLKRADKVQLLHDWKISKNQRGIQIQTVNPASEWTFQVRNNVFRIECSDGFGFITAIAPATTSRIPARMSAAEYEYYAKPVVWRGTREVSNAYGGRQTTNLSYLPVTNQGVLYLSMGQVSSRNLYCLFDRPTDTMIRFSRHTSMRRHSENQDEMIITIPCGSELAPDIKPGDAQSILIIADYYTKTLGLPVYAPMDVLNVNRPPVIWNSWTNYYSMVTEEDIVSNCDWIADNLKDYGLKYVVLDDGYDRKDQRSQTGNRDRMHNWIHNWDEEKFPHGGKWLAQYVRSKGFVPGIWVVPNSYGGALEEHPDWYLRDRDGEYVLDYNTPALDCTNPEVLEFVRELFETFRDWGYEYYKMDGEFALTEYIPSIDKDKLYDKTIAPLQAYVNRLKVIREAAGETAFLEGCPAGTPLQGIGYFNSYFTGEDIYKSWLGMYSFFNSLNANIFLNHIVCYVMPGEGICVSPKIGLEEARSVFNPALIRTATSREANLTSLGTTMNEARTVVTFATLSGTPYSFADRLFDLPEERIELLKKTLPAMPIIPIDLFSRGSYDHWNLWREFTPEEYTHDFPRIIDLKINAESGVYDVVASTNWTDGELTRSISFADNLGVDPDRSYLVFDFWNQKLEGVFKEKIDIDIEPHDTRVFIVKPALEWPQFVATNRHITSAYSLKKLVWNSQESSLSGVSETIADAAYSIYIHVPDGYIQSGIKSNAKILSYDLRNGMLEAVFQGQKELVNWRIDFETDRAKSR